MKKIIAGIALVASMATAMPIQASTINRFENRKLGISFYYNSDQKIRVQGNRVYVGDNFVEVFKKTGSDSLEKAVEKKFLKNIPKDKCWVKKSVVMNGLPKSYTKTDAIAYPVNKDPNGPWWDVNHGCPKDYSQINSVRYFLADRSHPNQFAFFEAGQDINPISEETKTDWTTTFRFLPENRDKRIVASSLASTSIEYPDSLFLAANFYNISYEVVGKKFKSMDGKIEALLQAPMAEVGFEQATRIKKQNLMIGKVKAQKWTIYSKGRTQYFVFWREDKDNSGSLLITMQKGFGNKQIDIANKIIKSLKIN